MSIIERVAALLGPIARPNLDSSTPGKNSSIPELDLIGRVNGESNERSRASEARNFVGQPAAKEPKAVRPASRTIPTIKVDLDRLRRQSIITPDSERTPIAEDFRRIKRQILENASNPSAGAPTNLVMVTSAIAGEGKTFCAVNLAISIALEMDYSVLLVDADVAKPSIPEVLGLQVKKGLMDLLRDRRLELAEVLCKIHIGKLTLLPGGTVHKQSTELLASGGMRELLREMADRYRDRIIIFDSPPLLAASEAAVLASQMGQIIMVVEAGKTTQATLKQALGHLNPRKIAGLVLNKGQSAGLGYRYGGYGHGTR